MKLNFLLILILISIQLVAQDSSIVKSAASGSKSNEIVSYIGLNVGYASPLASFGDKNITNTSAGLAVNGLSLTLVNFGMYWGKFGFNVRWFGNAHIMQNGVSNQAWGYGSIMVGPTYTLDLFRNAYLDLKPSVGSMSSQIYLGKDIVKEGSGLGLGLGTQFRFNFARKWAGTVNLDYITSSQTLKNVGIGTGADYKQSITAISTNLGMIYYFKAPNYLKK
jgi:hypothetical protein